MTNWQISLTKDLDMSEIIHMFTVLKISEMTSDYNLLKDRNFSYYLNTLSIEEDSNVLILSPVHHYYYNFEEIKDVRILVHTKELNKITELKRFVNNTIHVLSDDSKFIGCFRDTQFRKSVLYRSRLFYWLIHCMDVQIYRSMSRKQVMKLFTKLGLEFLDMTEIDGLTYFCVKKI